MSISTKKKRKLIYDNKTYYWHVSPDYDRGELRKNFNILHIIADDKSLDVKHENKAIICQSIKEVCQTDDSQDCLGE
jgi:hypothetical protein